MKLWNRNFGSISEGPEVANLSLLVKINLLIQNKLSLLFLHFFVAVLTDSNLKSRSSVFKGSIHEMKYRKRKFYTNKNNMNYAQTACQHAKLFEDPWSRRISMFMFDCVEIRKSYTEG